MLKVLFITIPRCLPESPYQIWCLCCLINWWSTAQPRVVWYWGWRTRWEWVLRDTGKLQSCLWAVWLVTGTVLFHGKRHWAGFRWPHPERRHPALGPYTFKKSFPIFSLIRPPFTNPLPFPVDSMVANTLLTDRLHALSHHSFWWNRNNKNYI